MTEASFSENNCTGTLNWEDSYDTEVCASDGSTTDDYVGFEAPVYEMVSCVYPKKDDDDSASAAALSWLGAFVASMFGYILATRA